MNPIETIKFLGVREKFIFDRSVRPYSASIREIEKISQCDNP